MRNLLKAVSLAFAFFLLVFAFTVEAQVPPAGETITKKDANIIRLLSALENPNYDIVFVIDVSDSMKAVLPEWKLMAESVVDLSRIGDTLVLIKFDEDTKPAQIKQIDNDRQKELFKGMEIRKTTTTKGFGTDIRKAYWTTLKTLKEFDEGRVKRREPLRIQRVVFISDGDDMPPSASPFRNPGSKESVELSELMDEAKKTRRIDIIPIGMKFEGYEPRFKSVKEESKTPVNEKISSELKSFTEKLKEVFERDYEIKEDKEKVAFAPFRFYVEWLSDRLTLKKTGKTTKNPYQRAVQFELLSAFQKLAVKNLTVRSFYNGTGEGRAKDSNLPAPVLAPGKSLSFVSEVNFPKNWSFSPREFQGVLDVEVTGIMEAEPPSSKEASASPSPAAPAMAYNYPFISKRETIPMAGKLPPCTELFVLVTALGLGAVGGFGFVVYRKMMPLTVTLKTEEKGRAFRLKNGESITLGGGADFEIEGCQELVAIITRRDRKFILTSKKEGVLSDAPQAGIERELAYGGSFTLTIDGTYHAIQLLEGDQEYGVPQEEAQAAPPPSDEEGGNFSF
ncbi:MAG: vWA domain-containing protein [Candidatus Eremiobacteraeota bacterium]|nr:vWA domain-containing protein [Candidatus Eremiobacteraeota bacterium]